MSTLTNDDLRRYSRHLNIPEFGIEGQEKLKSAKVLIVGTGGLGSPSSLYLAAAGVGTIGLVEFDTVDYSNLQRQILFSDGQVGQAKIDAAEQRLREINPLISIVKHPFRLDKSNVLALFNDYDVVLDGTDNFPSRYLINDACVFTNTPNVHGSILRFEGQASVYNYNGPCYRCLYPEPPPADAIPNCAEAGVLGVLPGLVGTIQATEAIKLICGIGKPLSGRLMMIDALNMQFRELRIKKDPACPVCGDEPTISELIEYRNECKMSEELSPYEITPAQVEAKKLDSTDDFILVDVRQDHERQLCNIGGEFIPLGEFAERYSELDKGKEIVIYCRSGARSGQATHFLLQNGYTNVKNMVGGILRWSDDVDPSIPKY